MERKTLGFMLLLVLVLAVAGKCGGDGNGDEKSEERMLVTKQRVSGSAAAAVKLTQTGIKPRHLPSSKPSVTQTVAQFWLLKQTRLKVRLCDQQSLASVLFTVTSV
ncbi:unnamed protein product [Sphenostylis stenocarpa]|uniref:Secreted protein n=1 Tax=Sphenostylis stenocarpa TaxID=92480 RepID=A0AA86S362_9FABA|nr:unnamed protein product [Sphenostylis stenocarpa]